MMTAPFQRLNHRRPLVIESFGKCIYCYTPHKTLTKEHVIPKALGGALIILGASCPDCQKITQTFEQECFRNNFGHHRIKMNYPTGQPKQRPSSLPLLFFRNGKWVPIDTPMEEHPYALALPLLGPPRLCLGLPPIVEKAPLTFRGFVLPGNIKEEVEVPTHFKLSSFHQFLAKLAHGYCVSQLGLDAFKPLLPDLIIGKRYDLGTYLVGTAPNGVDSLPKPEREMIIAPDSFELNGVKYLALKIQLFASMFGTFPDGKQCGTPIYYVIVGEQP